MIYLPWLALVLLCICIFCAGVSVGAYCHAKGIKT